MTFKGAMRSAGAAIRKAEGEQQRQAREATRQIKQQQKEEALTKASEAARQYYEYIGGIDICFCHSQPTYLSFTG